MRCSPRVWTCLQWLQGTSAAVLLDPDAAPLTAIMHPVDELKLWVDLSVSQGCPMLLRRRAQALGAIFGPLVPKFQVLRADHAGRLLFMKSSGPGGQRASKNQSSLDVSAQGGYNCHCLHQARS